MKFYHVSFSNENAGIKIFIPRIPESAGDGEDKNIARICLAPSVEKCIQAIEAGSQVLKTGTEFTVYEAEISLASKKPIRPDELNLKGLVPDSMENEEYWYLSSLTMWAKRYKILSFFGYCDIAWNCIDANDMLSILGDMLENESIPLRRSI